MEFKYLTNVDSNFTHGGIMPGSMFAYNGIIYKALKIMATTGLVGMYDYENTNFPSVIDPSQWEIVPIDCNKCSFSCTTADQNDIEYGPHCYFADKHLDACNENPPHFCAAFRVINSGFMPMSM